MRVAGFYIVYVFLWLLTLLPLRLIYMLSDLLFLIIYYVSGYRRKVVFDNLRNAFPEKSETEIRKVAGRFYRHFCDFLLESVKTMHMSKKQVNERFRFENPEIFLDYFNRGRSVVLVSGHYGNWEWMVDFPSHVPYKVLAIYKPLADPKFDRLIRRIRESYAQGSEMVAMDDVYRRIIKSEREGQKIMTWFLGDQTPPRSYPLWLTFMNREAPFYSGPEKIARKFGHVVVFMDILKTARGRYKVKFTPLFEEPEKTAPEEITKAHVKALEKTIREKPEFWLWSHRRWKHSRRN